MGAAGRWARGEHESRLEDALCVDDRWELYWRRARLSHAPDQAPTSSQYSTLHNNCASTRTGRAVPTWQHHVRIRHLSVASTRQSQHSCDTRKPKVLTARRDSLKHTWHLRRRRQNERSCQGSNLGLGKIGSKSQVINHYTTGPRRHGDPWSANNDVAKPEVRRCLERCWWQARAGG